MSIDYPHLYHLTVKPPDTIAGAVFCTFGQEECLVLARGQWLEILQLNASGELETVSRTNLYATIRCLDRIRIPRVAKDLLTLTSDSGELTVLDFDWETQNFSKFAECEISLPKLNRSLPGEYLAVDPRGRVALAASISNARTALVFNNEGLSGDPIEVALPSTFCYSVVALDRGYENPAFACLERFRFTKEKMLTLYEFNLSLNNLFKSWSRPVSDDCDFVIPLPGGRDGPSGMLIFEGSHVSLCNATSPDNLASLDIEVSASSAQLMFLGRNSFFVLICTSTGQLKAISFDKSETPDGVTALSVTDLAITVPAIPSTIATSRSGLVFLGASSGNHSLYQIAELNPLQLESVTELLSISPVKSATLQRKQLLLGVGDSDETSKLARLSVGLPVDGLASTPLPGTPEVVFATRRNTAQSEYDDLIVLGFADSTTVSLAVGDDGSVEEESEASTGIASDVKTLGIARLQHGLLQIHPAGLRYITEQEAAPENSGGGSGAPKISPWRAPQTARIIAYCATPTQAVLVLSNNKIVYFEEKDGALQESQQRLDLGATATAICFAGRGPGEIRSTRLFVALDDETLREYSIPSFKSNGKHRQLAYAASSLVHIQEKVGKQHEVIYVGHFNGTLSRISQDSSAVRVLGSSPVKLTALLPSQKKVVALSSRAWLIEDEHVISLLLGDSVTGLKSSCSFAIESAPANNCLVAVNQSSLEVFTIGSNLTKLRVHVDFSDKIASGVSSAPILRHSSNNIVVYRDSQVGMINRSLEVESVSAGSSSSTTDSTPRAAVNVRFESHNNEEFLVLSFGASISVLRYAETGQVELLHETKMGSAECSALLPFNGKLLAGVGNKLVVYELGKKQLLRHYEFVLSDLSVIRALQAAQNTVFVGDSRRSVTLVAWNSQTATFSVVAEDPVPRSVLSMILLDSETVCIGSQYGEITILRFINSGEPPHLLQLVANFWVPDAIVGLHRGNLSPLAANDAIVYTGLQGTVGVLIPLISASETEFVETMQTTLTNTTPKSLAGRVIEDFHGYYAPTRNVVDGDLLEQSVLMDENMPNLEEVLELNGPTIINRLEDIRYRCVTITM